MMNNIEVLPNEILLRCFQYLHAYEIFYSFIQLNYRFNQLIKSIPLYVDFQNTSNKLFFEQICDPVIKNQIYSLI